MPWYRQGTVSVTSGQTTVTGTSTDFALNSRVGDAFQGPNGQWYEVANIASATVLSILPAYQGPTVAAGSYGLAPMQGYVKESADRLRQLVQQFGSTLALLGNPVDVAALRVNIGAAVRGANSDITSLGGLTTPLSVAQGGTGSSTSAGAKTSLGIGDIGVGQSWQDLTSSRQLGVAYVNATGRPIQVTALVGPTSAASVSPFLSIDGKVLRGAYAAGSGAYIPTVTGIVPPGASYSITIANGTAGLFNWLELR